MKTEQELWDMIEKANWKLDHDYDRIKNEWSKLPKNEQDEIDKFISNKINIISSKFQKDWLGDPGISVSDDGWMDLTAEVVGRGKEFYDNITVKKLQEMADTDDYEECFSYSTHF